jgi:hypothetical protein
MTTQRSPQDQAINHSLPVQVYEIWEYEGEIHGSIIDYKPFWQAQRDYEVSYDLKGANAHFLLVTNDRSILRLDAISFARAIYEKKVRYIHIDLAAL